MKRGVILSPYAATATASVKDHERYLQRLIRLCAFSGVAPYASHRMMPGALDDSRIVERRLGMACEEPWLAVADLVVAGCDYGWSRGMLNTHGNASLPIFEVHLADAPIDVWITRLQAFVEDL